VCVCNNLQLFFSFDKSVLWEIFELLGHFTSSTNTHVQIANNSSFTKEKRVLYVYGVVYIANVEDQFFPEFGREILHRSKANIITSFLLFRSLVLREENGSRLFQRRVLGNVCGLTEMGSNREPKNTLS
jgi:hypothetical protein